MNILLKYFFKIIPSDFFARKYPISVKGLVTINGKIALVKNERKEWEFPGGKIELHETPEQCVIREIKEELSVDATVDHLLDAWMFKVVNKVNVFVVVYRCKPLIIDEQSIKISSENEAYGLFSPEEIDALNMPGNYKATIQKMLKNGQGQ